MPIRKSWVDNYGKWRTVITLTPLLWNILLSFILFPVPTYFLRFSLSVSSFWRIHTHTHTSHMTSMYISPNSLYNLIFLFLLRKFIICGLLSDQYVFVFINRWIYWWITHELEKFLYLYTFLDFHRFENRPWSASLVHKITWYFHGLKQFSAYSCSTSSFHSLETNSMLTMFMPFVTSYS